MKSYLVTDQLQTHINSIAKIKVRSPQRSRTEIRGQWALIKKECMLCHLVCSVYTMLHVNCNMCENEQDCVGQAHPYLLNSLKVLHLLLVRFTIVDY